MSQSGKHYLKLQDDGNLVVLTAADIKVWGLDEFYGSTSRVQTVHFQNDGNLVAKSSSGSFLWGALSANTTPNAQLIIDESGVLQLVGEGSNILWASDGQLSSTDFVIDYGWKSYRLLKDPSIVIMGSRAVTPRAMSVVADIYSQITQRLSSSYPKERFDGYVVYVTNGEPWSELSVLRPVGQMWPDKTGSNSGDFLRGGTNANYLWIDEQMICKTGVVTRSAAFAAGQLPVDDTATRTFDQVVHEFGHAIDLTFDLRSRIHQVYNGGFNPVEQFPGSVQHFFSVPKGNLNASELRFMQDIFTSSTTFSCDDYNVKISLNAGEVLGTDKRMYSPNGKYHVVMQNDGNLCIYQTEGTRFVWCSMSTGVNDATLMMQADGNLCIHDATGIFKWGTYQDKNYALGSGYKTVLTDNGKLNVLDSSGKVLWANP